jgi:hypothetical protein
MDPFLPIEMIRIIDYLNIIYNIKFTNKPTVCVLFFYDPWYLYIMPKRFSWYVSAYVSELVRM